MLHRIAFAIRKGLRQRANLRAIRRTRVNAPYHVCLSTLYQQGVRGIIWDFDGVLATQDEIEVDPRMRPLLKESITLWPQHVFILSNKPLSARMATIKQYFPDIQFIHAPRKKPYPDGILKIIAETHLAPQQLTLIDDRLLTGALATQLAGIRILYTTPITNFKKHFFKESFFAMLRGLERVLFL